MKNFFEPALIIDGVNLKQRMFQDVLDEQTTIALLSKGAITISETDNMPPSDRPRILKLLQQIEERKQQEFNKVQNTK